MDDDLVAQRRYVLSYPRQIRPSEGVRWVLGAAAALPDRAEGLVEQRELLGRERRVRVPTSPGGRSGSVDFHAA